MIHIEGWTSIRKVRILLDVMNEMLKKDICPEKIKECLLDFEEETNQLFHKSRNMEETFTFIRDLGFVESHNNWSQKIYGGELFDCGSIHYAMPPTPIKDLFKNGDFDFNRLNELKDLFDKLIELNVYSVYISKSVPFEELSHFIDSPYATEISENFEALDFSNSGLTEINKFYCDGDIEFALVDLDYDNNKNYFGELKNNVTWLFSGRVMYYKNQQLYLGLSSPHTQFDFCSSTLYPDISKFPTKEELYSPREVKALTLYKKIINQYKNL